MQKLFIDKTIEINASTSKVWNVLTKSVYTDKWAMEFREGKAFHIESNWHLGSPVIWKDDTGMVLVEGTVTEVEQNKHLHFTVTNTKGERHTMTFTYELTNDNGTKLLHIKEGDFSVISDGGKYFEINEQVWGRVLLRVKELAEKIK